MPAIIKKGNFNYKDPNTGEYKGVNVIAERTTDEIIASIPKDYTTLTKEVLRQDREKLNKPTDSPDGVSGQLLRTNGDGTTAWVDEGLPTDEQTANAVDAWLDDHPEATTTVEDGSITNAKLHESVRDNLTPSYVPVKIGTFVYTSSESKKTTVHYAIIDKQYKPRLVMAGDVYKTGSTILTEDVGIVSMREGATIACNAGTLHSSNTTAGTIIVDGVVKHENDTSYSEWGSYDLENLYMTSDGQLHVIDTFASTSEMLSHNPVWSFNGWNAIYKDGHAVDTFYKDVYAPKTVVAQDVEGNYLVFASGGRRYDNYGMNYADVIDAIFNKIIFEAEIIYNCDGGGSTSLIAHQIRLNDLVEATPRKVANVLVFEADNVSKYSDYEAGYSEYLSDCRARKDVDLASTNEFKVVSDNNSIVGITFYKGTSNALDKYTYDRLMKIAYDLDRHMVYIDALRSTGRYLNVFGANDANDSVALLGKEAFRSTAIRMAEGTYTTNNHGIIDSNVISAGGILKEYYVLNVISLTGDVTVMPCVYSNRYIFAVRDIYTWEEKASTQIQLRVMWVTDPSFTDASN